MNNTKTTKRALLSSVMAIVLCLAMLIGTTFAWFTDSASTAVNKIQAGNLDVALEMKTGTDGQGNDIWVNAEGQTLAWQKAQGAENEDVLWEPGATYALPELRIVNKGNLALKYKIQITGIQGDAKLNEVIDWTINDAPINLTEKHLLAGQADAPFTIKGQMQKTAGNEYQGLTIDGIGITVYATQDAVENDSFNNQYDMNAEYRRAVFNGGSGIVDYNIYAQGYDGAIYAHNGAQVTVNADVTAKEDKNYAMAVWADGANTVVNIEGGYFTQEITGTDNQYDMIYASGGAKINISGGTFKLMGGDYKWTLNCKDNSGSVITVTGGTFYKFDPSANRAGQGNEVVVPDGYSVYQNGDWYEVVDGAVVSTEAGLKDALAGTDSTIYLTKDIALTAPITIGRDCTLVGNGSATISAYPVSVEPTANVTFKNVNFATPDNTNHKASSVYASGLKGEVVFDGCTFTNPQWECIQITPMDGAEVVVTNCTFVVDGNGTYAQAGGTKVERMLHIQNTAASGKYTAVITDNTFIGVDLCRNSVIDVDDIEAFANVTCGGNTFADHYGTSVSTLADGKIYVNINRKYDAANIATNTFAQFTQTPAAALHH